MVSPVRIRIPSLIKVLQIPQFLVRLLRRLERLPQPLPQHRSRDRFSLGYSPGFLEKGGRALRDAFSGRYRPTQDDFERLWGEGLIVPDTDVLFGLYRRYYSKYRKRTRERAPACRGSVVAAAPGRAQVLERAP